jgi:SAM-dependent methyltransferase
MRRLIRALRRRVGYFLTAAGNRVWPHPVVELALARWELDDQRILALDPQVYQVGLSNALARKIWVEGALAKIPAGARLLDAGAGESPYRVACRHLEYVSQDLAKYDGFGNAVGLQTGQWNTSSIDIVSDIAEIPEPNASFDAILCTEVLEHVPNPVSAIKELARLLKPGGTLILTAPFCSLTHFAPYHYSTGFTRYFFATHLRNFGFEVVEMTPNGNFFEYIGQEVRRMGEMANRYCDDEIRKSERYGVQIMLGMLERLSGMDQNSSEMLHFGYHVRATRNVSP